MYSACMPDRRVLALLAAEAAIIYGCYLVGVYLAQRFVYGASFATDFLLDDNGLLRLLFVVATIMFALYFSGLYRHLHVASRIRLIQQVCLAVGVAFLAQAFVGYLATGWIVPRYAMLFGSLLVLIVIPSLRMLWGRVQKAGWPRPRTV